MHGPPMGGLPPPPGWRGPPPGGPSGMPPPYGSLVLVKATHATTFSSESLSFFLLV
jgi:hypothetical protein